MSDIHVWDINVGISDGICQWISDKGGPSGITSQNIINELGPSYIYEQPVVGYSFIVTSNILIGIGAYWLGYIELGDQWTGCDFA